MRRTRKIILSYVGIMCAAVVFFSPTICAVGQDKTTITYMTHDARPPDKEAISNVISRFEELHPNIHVKVQYIPWSGAVTKLLTMSQTNTLPDCGFVEWFARFAEMGVVEPLDKLITPEIKLRYPEAIWSQGEAIVGGEVHTYVLSVFKGTLARLYNKKYFQEAGLTREDISTYEGFEKACEKLTKDTNGDGVIDRWGYSMGMAARPTSNEELQMVMEGFGARLVATPYTKSIKPESLTWKSPEAVAGLKWYTDLYKKGLVNPDAVVLTTYERVETFLRGTTAMVSTGPWSLPRLKGIMDELGYGLGAQKLSAGPTGEIRGQVWNAGRVGIYSTTKHKKESWEFIKFLASDEGMRIYCYTNGMMPSSNTFVHDPRYRTGEMKELYKAYLDQIETGCVQLPIWMRSARPAMVEEWGPAVQAVLTGSMTVEEAVGKMEDAIREALL